MLNTKKQKSKILDNKFPERDYLTRQGNFGEHQLLPVNHLCIQEDIFIFNDIILPYGARDIEDKNTFIIGEILHNILHILQSEENKDREIIICGREPAKKMLARKLEDRLKRKLNY